jgi:hypothetical protein
MYTKQGLLLLLLLNSSQGLASYECDQALGYDAMISDQINQTANLYDEAIENARKQALNAFLTGAGGRSTNGGALAAGAIASQPYENRMNELILERDTKLNDLKFQQKKARFENKRCYP